MTCPSVFSIENPCFGFFALYPINDARIFFDFDSSKLNYEAKEVLDANMADIREVTKHVAIVIKGHTDLRGSIEYNEMLSKERSFAVRRYLMDKGIDSFRLAIMWSGEADAVIAESKNHDERLPDRRVDLFGDYGSLDPQTFEVVPSE